MLLTDCQHLTWQDGCGTSAGSSTNQLRICQACTCCLQSAQKEIALWFKPEELAEYKQMTQAAILE